MAALYNSLSAARHETRYLILLSGEADDHLVGKLETVSLDEKPEYEALSYVWGRRWPGSHCFWTKSRCP
jgi:hypothetical protein